MSFAADERCSLRRTFMKIRFVASLGLSAVVGMLLAWACIFLLGVFAVFVSEHRFFGLSVHLVIAAESFLAWTPLSLLTGLIFGSLLRESAMVVAFATVAAAFLFLLLSAPEPFWISSTLGQAAETVAFYLTSGGALLLLAVPLGAAIALRLQRAKPSSRGASKG